MNKNHMLTKTGKRIVAVTVSSAMVVSLVAGCGKQVPDAISDKIEDQVTDGAVAALTTLGHGNSDGKSETVYAIADASGNITSTIVSAWLSNASESSIINDYSTLENITNVKGNEQYSLDADGNLVWNADGKDIYYQGTTTKELPVGVQIQYELDGVEMTPEEIAGKSGALTITFTYTNHLSKEVEINGETQTIYQPFAVISGTVFDNDKVSNITVTNGRAVNDGDRTIVVGMALPGLADSLGLDDIEYEGEALNINLPEEVVITADVTNFSMATTLTVEDNSILKNYLSSDSEQEFDSESLKEQLDKLTDASTQLVNGTADLFDGADKLAEGAHKVDDGAGELAEGADKLATGTQTLATGASELSAGADKLSQGANQLATGANTLSEGADKLEDGASSLASGLSQIKDGTTSLNGGLVQLHDSVATLPASAQTLVSGATAIKNALKSGDMTSQERYGIYEAATAIAAGTEQLESGLVSNDATNPGIYEGAASISAGATQLQNGLVSNDATNPGIYEGALAIALGAKSDNAEQPGIYEAAGAVKTGLSNLVTKLTEANTSIATNTGNAASYDEEAYNQVLALVQSGKLTMEEAKPILTNIKTSQTIDSQVSTSVASADLSTQLAPANEALTQIQTGAATINAAANSIAKGAQALYAGAGQIKAGADALMTGAKKLYAGVTQVNAAATGIQNGVDTMISGNDGNNLNAMILGLQTLQTGSTTLVDGVLQLKLGSASLLSGVTDAATGADTLAAGTTTLANGAKELADGTTTLKEGAESLAEGSNKLSDGATELNTGAHTLSDGATTLHNGTSELATGADSLKDGAEKLKDGMAEFDEEAIEKLTTLLNENIGGIRDRLKAVMDYAEEYHSFSGSTDDADTGVKFIIRTEGVEAQ